MIVGTDDHSVIPILTRVKMFADPASDDLALRYFVVKVVGQLVDVGGQLARFDLEPCVLAALELGAPVLVVVVVCASNARERHVGWAKIERRLVVVVDVVTPPTRGGGAAVVSRPAPEPPPSVRAVVAEVAVQSAQ